MNETTMNQRMACLWLFSVAEMCVYKAEIKTGIGI